MRPHRKLSWREQRRASEGATHISEALGEKGLGREALAIAQRVTGKSIEELEAQGRRRLYDAFRKGRLSTRRLFRIGDYRLSDMRAKLYLPDEAFETVVVLINPRSKPTGDIGEAIKAGAIEVVVAKEDMMRDIAALLGLTPTEPLPDYMIAQRFSPDYVSGISYEVNNNDDDTRY